MSKFKSPPPPLPPLDPYSLQTVSPGSATLYPPQTTSPLADFFFAHADFFLLFPQMRAWSQAKVSLSVRYC